MTDIILRQAVEDDIQQLAGLLEKLFAIEKDFQACQKLQQHGLCLLLESVSATVVIAEDITGIIGMITGQIVISTVEGGPSLLIEDLYVAELARGQGVGTLLLDEVGKWGYALGARRMQLLADSKNADALAFYEEKGWRRTQLICLRQYFSCSDI